MPRVSRQNLPKPATLADIGRAVGVSAMSASAVLNASKTSTRISEETRRKILEVAARMKYRPNAAARALNRRKMNTLGLAGVVDSGGLNAYFLEVLNGVLEAAGRFDQNVTVFTLHDWNADAGKIADFCDGRIDGLILVAPVLTKPSPDIFPKHTPFVSLHSNTKIPGVVNIETNEDLGSFEIVRQLVQQGHTDILHISGTPGMLGTKRRLAGYKRALATLGRRDARPMVIEADFSYEIASSELKAWMQRNVGKRMPTAIFCANDSGALGCMDVLAQAGLRVPRDVSVVGFDDTIAARTSMPQLTTVQQPLKLMGATAVELLLHPESVKVDRDGTIVFPTRPVSRASVAPPPSERLPVPHLP
jgi:LacI family transcriptional regulator